MLELARRARGKARCDDGSRCSCLTRHPRAMQLPYWRMADIGLAQRSQGSVAENSSHTGAGRWHYVSAGQVGSAFGRAGPTYEQTFLVYPLPAGPFAKRLAGNRVFLEDIQCKSMCVLNSAAGRMSAQDTGVSFPDGQPRRSLDCRTARALTRKIPEHFGFIMHHGTGRSASHRANNPVLTGATLATGHPIAQRHGQPHRVRIWPRARVNQSTLADESNRREQMPTRLLSSPADGAVHGRPWMGQDPTETRFIPDANIARHPVDIVRGCTRIIGMDNLHASQIKHRLSPKPPRMRHPPQKLRNPQGLHSHKPGRVSGDCMTSRIKRAERLRRQHGREITKTDSSTATVGNFVQPTLFCPAGSGSSIARPARTEANTYSVELWFRNDCPPNRAPVTASLFSGRRRNGGALGRNPRGVGRARIQTRANDSCSRQRTRISWSPVARRFHVGVDGRCGSIGPPEQGMTVYLNGDPPGKSQRHFFFFWPIRVSEASQGDICWADRGRDNFAIFQAMMRRFRL